VGEKLVTDLHGQLWQQDGIFYLEPLPPTTSLSTSSTTSTLGPIQTGATTINVLKQETSPMQIETTQMSSIQTTSTTTTTKAETVPSNAIQTAPALSEVILTSTETTTQTKQQESTSTTPITTLHPSDSLTNIKNRQTNKTESKETTQSAFLSNESLPLQLWGVPRVEKITQVLNEVLHFIPFIHSTQYTQHKFPPSSFLLIGRSYRWGSSM
jgi:hypothetical protein